MRPFALGTVVVLLSACAALNPRARPIARPTAVIADRLAERVVGCYLLRPGAWEQNALLNEFYPAAFIPRRLRLTSTALRGWDAMQSDTLPLYAVETDTSSSRSRWLFTFWRAVRVGSDSIHIGAPLPFAGAHLRLVPAPAGLVGTLTTFTDAIPPDGIAHAEVPATLDRVACPAP